MDNGDERSWAEGIVAKLTSRSYRRTVQSVLKGDKVEKSNGEKLSGSGHSAGETESGVGSPATDGATCAQSRGAAFN